MAIARFCLAVGAAYIYYTAIQEILLSEVSIFRDSYGGYYQFLTILGLAISLVQECVAVLAVISGLQSINYVQDILLQLTSPLEVLISILYWSIKFVDESLVIDPRNKAKPGPTLDRMLHLWPAIMQCASAVLFPTRRWNASPLKAGAWFIACAYGYWLWVNEAYKHNGFYPYPLLAVLGPLHRAVLFGFAAMLVLVVYTLLQRLQRILNRY